MPTLEVIKFQIGKAGVTDGTIVSLQNAFKTHKIIRISLIRSSVPNREKVAAIADDLVSKLGGNYTYRIIGFTIVMKKRGFVAPRRV